MKSCTKPSCARPGAAVLAYDYAEKRAILDDAGGGELSPHVYVLCNACAEKLRPPNGWRLDDLRAKPPLFLDRIPAAVPVSVGASPDEEDGDHAPDTSRRQLFFGYSG